MESPGLSELGCGIRCVLDEPWRAVDAANSFETARRSKLDFPPFGYIFDALSWSWKLILTGFIEVGAGFGLENSRPLISHPGGLSWLLTRWVGPMNYD